MEELSENRPYRNIGELLVKRSPTNRAALRLCGCDPAILNGILAVAAEYGSTYALDAAMNLVDRAIWRGSQPNDMLLIQCSALREALNSPSFADIPAVVSRKQEMIEDMMKRLEE